MTLKDVLNWNEVKEMTPKAIEELTGESNLEMRSKDDSAIYYVITKNNKPFYHLKEARQDVYYEGMGLELTHLTSPDLITEEYYAGICEKGLNEFKDNWKFILTKHIEGKQADIGGNEDAYQFAWGRQQALHEFLGLGDIGSRHFILTSDNNIKRIDFGYAFMYIEDKGVSEPSIYLNKCHVPNQREFLRGMRMENKKIKHALTTNPKIGVLLNELKTASLGLDDIMKRYYPEKGSFLLTLKKYWHRKKFL